MHITIERDGCISCGLCEGTCPSVFRIAEDGLAEVHHQPETAEEQAGAQEAAGGCPVAVIHVSGERKRKGRPSGLPFCIDRKNLKVCPRDPLISRK